MTVSAFFLTLVFRFAATMNTAYDTERVPPSTSSWAKGIVTGVVLTILLGGIIVWLTTGVGLLQLLRSYSGGSLFHIDQPTVVRQIQQLQRLETVSFSMDKIISGEHDTPYLPKFLVSDRLLLVVHGDVIAGVDLGQLQSQDVSIQGQTITVRIPKSQILVTNLDNSKTRVYSRDTGLFSSPDPNLETEVRQEAERQLQAAALQGNILKTADDNARSTLSALLRSLGFTTVDFR
jgi:Protein of unknown function (DUF4230)